jgi:bifunctional non-homologous end joining protein LigD
VATPKLAEYEAKRYFRRTKEPTGRGDVLRSALLRFVIQKHAATRLHYDLRLELGGHALLSGFAILTSWPLTPL